MIRLGSKLRGFFAWRIWKAAIFVVAVSLATRVLVVRIWRPRLTPALSELLHDSSLALGLVAGVGLNFLWAYRDGIRARAGKRDRRGESAAR